MYNLFGDNIRPGGKCYAIINKHPIPAEFHLNNKPNNASINGMNAPTRSAPLINNVPQSVRPYLMSFACLPDGGRLPPEATMYYDEHNELRRDGLAIYLGKIWSVPIHHVYKPNKNYYDVDPITRRIPESKEQFAYTDDNRGVERDSIMLMKLILDSDDGLAPF